MSHFAQIDNNNVVIQVIVAEQDFIDSGAVGDPSRWVQTSYNTYAGEHKLGGTPLRKNYAGPGYVYDSVRDAFVPPRPYPTWTLNEETCLWQAPVPMPDDGAFYQWDVEGNNWKKID